MDIDLAEKLARKCARRWHIRDPDFLGDLIQESRLAVLEGKDQADVIRHIDAFRHRVIRHNRKFLTGINHGRII